VQGGAGVKASGKSDAYLLADGEVFKDVGHTIAALSGKESATPSEKEATLQFYGVW
jgi:hypothetical protein